MTIGTRSLERRPMNRGLFARTRRRLAAAISLATLSLVAGCTPFSTYPPVETGEALVPWMYPVPQVMAKSLRATYDKTAGSIAVPDGIPALVYGLPEGISDGVWRQVGIDTGVEGAREMTPMDLELGVPAWAVEQVRIRNRRAEVDVVFPVTNGYERATVILEAEPFESYRVAFFQRWRVPVDPPAFTRSTAGTGTDDGLDPEAGQVEASIVDVEIDAEDAPEIEAGAETEIEVQTEIEVEAGSDPNAAGEGEA